MNSILYKTDTLMCLIAHIYTSSVMCFNVVFFILILLPQFAYYIILLCKIHVHFPCTLIFIIAMNIYILYIIFHPLSRDDITLYRVMFTQVY